MKIKNISDADMTLRGVDFPKGKAVEVKDESLLQKCLNTPYFEPAKARKNDAD